MSATTRSVALVAVADETRAALAAYLRRAGFEVHGCEELSVPSAFGALVILSTHDTSSDTLVLEVRSWIKLAKTQRVVVVTSKPTALNSLVATHGQRLYVLPAPVFGWDVVDALRAVEPTTPRGA